MFVIVGLGNPGKKYDRTRHNVGFMLVDKLQRSYGTGKWRRKFQGELAEGNIGGKKILFFKPQTYMNLSGNAVGELIRFYKLMPEQILVAYDDLDLNLGDIKVRDSGSAAGHNGVKSLLQAMPKNFTRIRVGIGRPGNCMQVTEYVLAPITNAELASYEQLNKSIEKHIPQLLDNKKSIFIEQVKNDIQKNKITT